MTTSDPKESFSKLLANFESQYEAKAALAENDMTKIHNMLPRALKALGIKYHELISKRVKELESAKRSVERRHEDRMDRSDLKRRLIKASNISDAPDTPDAWETFYNGDFKPFGIDDIGPFPDCDSMFKSLHDIGAIRILLYFPNQVEKVVDALEKLDGVKVKGAFEHGSKISPDMAELKRYVERMENKKDSWETKRNKIFSGYRATHIHVSLEDHTDRVIEIQVSTVVMNAWAEVEHDIIYKSSGETPDKKVMQILDTFNGIVMVGENALRELEEIDNQKKEDHEKESQMSARDIYQLGLWISSYNFETDNRLLGSGKHSLNYLENLFDVLEIMNQHTLKDVNDLIAGYLGTRPSETPLDQNLPLYLLLHKFRGNTRLDVPRFINQAERREARFLAKRVVESINIAAYLGVLDEFAVVMDATLPEERPSMVDLLDILHPQSPIVYDKQHPQDPHEYDGGDERITRFCQAFLSLDGLRNGLQKRSRLSMPVKALVELTLLLALSGLVAVPLSSSSQSRNRDTQNQNTRVTVSRKLCALLKDPKHCHWMPELCYAAEIMEGIQDEHRIPLGHMIAPITVETPWASNLLTELDMRNTVITLKQRISPMWLTIKTGGPKPNTWWETNNDDGSRGESGFRYEFHAEKSSVAHRSETRKHPGIFESRPDSEGNPRPQWSYDSQSPKSWAIRRAVDADEESKIRKGGTRANELLDFGNSLTLVDSMRLKEDKEEKKDASVLYELKIGGVDFHLLSRKDDYLLHKSSFHDNAPSRSLTHALGETDTAAAERELGEERPAVHEESDIEETPTVQEASAHANHDANISQDEAENNMPVDN